MLVKRPPIRPPPASLTTVLCRRLPRALTTEFNQYESNINYFPDFVLNICTNMLFCRRYEINNRTLLYSRLENYWREDLQVGFDEFSLSLLCVGLFLCLFTFNPKTRRWHRGQISVGDCKPCKSAYRIRTFSASYMSTLLLIVYVF